MTKLNIQYEQRRAQYFTEDLGNSIGLDMVLISRGSFVMGAPETEEESEDNERPQHTVTLTLFFISKYPVTQAQWRAVASLPQVNRELDPEPSEFKGDDRPIEQVTWYDAVEFCDRLFRKTGRSYRLPSEAEWEYACRAGTNTPFHFGETISTDLANYRGTDWTLGDKPQRGVYGRGEQGIYQEETTTVGSFGVANNFGIFDVHGNVWEWCLDHWHENYGGAPADGSAWLSKDETARRVLRGGSWLNAPGNCRSAYRSWTNPGLKNENISFRIVCSIPSEKCSNPTMIYPTVDEPTTQRNIDFSQLRDLLMEGRWREADEETWRIIRQSAGREGADYLYTADLAQISTHDLLRVDRLWSEYSRGKFGFSVQKKVWYEVNQNWQRFTNRVGWRKSESEMKDYASLDFSLNAPTGHLPYQFGTPDACWVGKGAGMGSEMDSLLSRQDL